MSRKVWTMMMTLIMIGCHLEACSGMENMPKENHLTPMETIRPADVPDPICVRDCRSKSHTPKEFADCIVGCRSSAIPMEKTRPDDVPDPVCIRNCSVTCHSEKECQDCLRRCG